MSLKKITIAPSLLSCDFLNLQKDLDAFKDIGTHKDNFNLWFHLDVMDGHFVPNLTFGHPVIEQLGKVVLPHHKLDAHLMVTNPAFYIETLKSFNIHNVTFHWETTAHHDRVLASIKEHYPSAGISLNPATSVDLVPDYILSKVDLVLIMTVNPGFGGQKFIEAGLDKIKKLSERRARLGANFSIQVDGGVNDQNASKLIASGADNFVAGSYMFKEGRENFRSQIAKLLAK